MAEDNLTGRDSDKFMLRLPEGMRERIAVEAKVAGRSMNAEIVHRLQFTLNPEPVISGVSVPRLMEEMAKAAAWRKEPGFVPFAETEAGKAWHARRAARLALKEEHERRAARIGESLGQQSVEKPAEEEDDEPGFSFTIPPGTDWSSLIAGFADQIASAVAAKLESERNAKSAAEIQAPTPVWRSARSVKK